MIQKIKPLHGTNLDCPDDTIQWRAKFSSGTTNASTGYITKYAIHAPSRGNLVLIPGMASNCKTEPLMQKFITWGLLHNYNVYSLETFLGCFQPDVNLKCAQKNTVPELINLVDRGLTIITQHAISQPLRIVAHSAGAVSTISAINRQIDQDRLINIFNITLFAPFISDERFNRIKKFYRMRSKSDEEFQRTPIRIENPFISAPHPRYISVMPEFFEQMINLNITTKAVEKYTFPVTIVAGGRDTKVSSSILHDLYKRLAALPNGNMFHYVLLPKSNHSFICPPNDWFYIISRINPYVSSYQSR